MVIISHYVTACICNFLNDAIVWIDRYEFYTASEIDCDNDVIKAYDGELPVTLYVRVMVRIMELATREKKTMRGALEVLDFWVAKHRISYLLKKSKLHEPPLQ